MAAGILVELIAIRQGVLGALKDQVANGEHGVCFLRQVQEFCWVRFADKRLNRFVDADGHTLDGAFGAVCIDHAGTEELTRMKGASPAISDPYRSEANVPCAKPIRASIFFARSLHIRPRANPIKSGRLYRLTKTESKKTMVLMSRRRWSWSCSVIAV